MRWYETLQSLLERILQECLRKQEHRRRLSARYDQIAVLIANKVNYLIALGKLKRLVWDNGLPRRRRLARAPCGRFYRLLKFACTRKTFDRVYKPVFADMQGEYFEALESKHIWKARWIIIRSTSSLSRDIMVSARWVILYRQGDKDVANGG